jgi:hypothetical protein
MNPLCDTTFLSQSQLDDIGVKDGLDTLIENVQDRSSWVPRNEKDAYRKTVRKGIDSDVNF